MAYSYQEVLTSRLFILKYCDSIFPGRSGQTRRSTDAPLSMERAARSAFTPVSTQ